MKFSDLPSPGQIRVSQKLRQVATVAISAAEIRNDQSKLPSVDLANFFKAAAKATPGYVADIEVPEGSAIVKSGLQTVAATGTGTKVTLTVANGKITKIELSE